MKIKGRAITWQQVLGGLHFVLLSVIISPICGIIIVLTCILKLLKLADKLIEFIIIKFIYIFGFIVDDCFKSSIVAKWVLDSRIKKQKGE